jgi:hypothetical protein
MTLENTAMEHLPQPDALREALQFLIRADIPADPKRLLIAVVMQAVSAEVVAAKQGIISNKPHPDWRSEEIEQALNYLQDKVAVSWQNADEIVMRLAHQLRRDPMDVRNKAIALGFGMAVDFRLARDHKLATSE